MAETTKAKVGLLGLMVELYDRMFPELRAMMTGFAQELVDTLAPFAEVDFPGVCNTRERVEQAVAHFEADDKDLLLVVLLTYAPSHIALRALKDTRLPIVIFNTQQLKGVTPAIVSMDTTRNHGMHGVQDLANVLLRAGRQCHVVTGHYQDPRALREI
jgi:L-arabinose isomerase